LEKVKVSIAGASGYSGAELLKIFQRHPHVHIDKLFANSSAGKSVAELYPQFRGRYNHTYQSYAIEAACTSDAVFLALPSGEAMNLAPELLKRGKKVIDLGGDFRLKDSAQYEKFYKHEHHAKALLAGAVYGLTEWNREQIKSATLLSNPGCYPTSAQLPLIPLIKENLVQPQNLVITAMSGVSGAGRSASQDLAFTEVNESAKAYKVGVHQHLPEIKQTLETLGGKNVSLSFVPHLVPLTRGILTTIHATLNNGVREIDILSAFDKYYKNEPFIRYGNDFMPEIKGVAHTNFVDIGFKIYDETNHLILVCAIDNLVKGAAGQAVQNFNLMFGMSETEGLL
jgi:N-acetyl-gamma-glutamyl-phosphate reductase